MWIGNEIDGYQAIDFEVDITEGKEPSFTQINGHNIIKDLTKKQMSQFIQRLSALYNRYNI